MGLLSGFKLDQLPDNPAHLWNSLVREEPPLQDIDKPTGCFHLPLHYHLVGLCPHVCHQPHDFWTHGEFAVLPGVVRPEHDGHAGHVHDHRHHPLEIHLCLLINSYHGKYIT